MVVNSTGIFSFQDGSSHRSFLSSSSVFAVFRIFWRDDANPVTVIITVGPFVAIASVIGVTITPKKVASTAVPPVAATFG